VPAAGAPLAAGYPPLRGEEAGPALQTRVESGRGSAPLTPAAVGSHAQSVRTRGRGGRLGLTEQLRRRILLTNIALWTPTRRPQAAMLPRATAILAGTFAVAHQAPQLKKPRSASDGGCPCRQGAFGCRSARCEMSATLRRWRLLKLCPRSTLPCRGNLTHGVTTCGNTNQYLKGRSSFRLGSLGGTVDMMPRTSGSFPSHDLSCELACTSASR